MPSSFKGRTYLLHGYHKCSIHLLGTIFIRTSYKGLLLLSDTQETVDRSHQCGPFFHTSCPHDPTETKSRGGRIVHYGKPTYRSYTDHMRLLESGKCKVQAAHRIHAVIAMCGKRKYEIFLSTAGRMIMQPIANRF